MMILVNMVKGSEEFSAVSSPLYIAPPGTRTPDPLIKSQLLESHKGKCGSGLVKEPIVRAAPVLARGAEKGPQTTNLDRDLIRVITAWPSLPEPVKAGIVAMVNAAIPKGWE